MIYLKHFKTVIDYNNYKNSYEFVLPNVSSCEEDLDFIVYNPEDEESNNSSGSGGGSDEPVLEGNKILCKYNIEDTSSKIILFYYQGGSGSGSGSGSGNRYTSIFSSMEVDGVEQEVTKSYTFNTPGEHIVLFTLADGGTSIHESVFYNCSDLTSVTIGNSVTSIGQYAFSGCSGLTSITIPDSVTSIGQYAFSRCSRLISIIVDSNNQIYDSRNNCNAIIETSTNKLIFGCKNTIIPDSVTSIGQYAFSSCSGLTSVTIGNSVESIAEGAFMSCRGLTSITIPDSVTSIGHWAFNGCSRLTSITCNAINAPTIISSTFQGMVSGGTLTVPAGSTGYNVWMITGNYYLGYYNWNKIEQ